MKKISTALLSFALCLALVLPVKAAVTVEDAPEAVRSAVAAAAAKAQPSSAASKKKTQSASSAKRKSSAAAAKSKAPTTSKAQAVPKAQTASKTQAASKKQAAPKAQAVSKAQAASETQAAPKAQAVSKALAVPKAQAAEIQIAAQRPLKLFLNCAKTADKAGMKKYVYNTLKLDSDVYFSTAATKRVYAHVKEENKKLFSYSILRTTLSADKTSATIQVKVNYNSLYKASYSATRSLIYDVAVFRKKYGRNPSAAALGSLFADSFSACVKENPSKASAKTFSVRVKKYGISWKVTSVSGSLLNTCCCDVDKGFDKAVQSYK